MNIGTYIPQRPAVKLIARQCCTTYLNGFAPETAIDKNSDCHSDKREWNTNIAYNT